jgi:hypothetical protein
MTLSWSRSGQWSRPTDLTSYQVGSFLWSIASRTLGRSSSKFTMSTILLGYIESWSMKLTDLINITMTTSLSLTEIHQSRELRGLNKICVIPLAAGMTSVVCSLRQVSKKCHHQRTSHQPVFWLVRTLTLTSLILVIRTKEFSCSTRKMTKRKVPYTLHLSQVTGLVTWDLLEHFSWTIYPSTIWKGTSLLTMRMKEFLVSKGKSRNKTPRFCLMLTFLL